MPPETMVALVCAVAGLLLGLGGILVGRGSAMRKRGPGSAPADDVETLCGEIVTLRGQFDEAQRELQELRARTGQEYDGREGGAALHQLTEDLENTKQQLRQARDQLASAAAQPGSTEELRIKLTTLEGERDELLNQLKAREVDARRTRQSFPVPAGDPQPSGDVNRDLSQIREENDRLRGELQAQDARMSVLRDDLDKEVTEKAKIAKERDEIREKQEAAERIMEGVRARSAALSQQLKEAQAALTRLKAAG